jgi:hypothetical protein
MNEPGPSRPFGGQPGGMPGRWAAPANIGWALGGGPPDGGPPGPPGGNNPGQPNHPFLQGGNGGGSLQGMPPEIFTGDRNLVETFMREWELYFLINSDTDRMATPFKRVALCLSFIRGLKVDSWITLQMRWLRTITMRQHNPIAPQDERIWALFKAEFLWSFTDMAKEQNTYKKLVTLKMTGGDLDTYIADFKKLAQDVGYHLNEKGAIILFRRGLPLRLHKAVVDKVHPAPQTIQQWQDAAGEQQIAYANWKAMMGEVLRTPPDCCQCWKGTLDQRNRRRERDPDTMDVDTIEITSLSKEERDEYMKKGLCFYCKGTNHVSCDCPKKKGRGQDYQRGGNPR